MIEFDFQIPHNVRMLERVCIRCSNVFFANNARIANGGAKYCSRVCSNKSTALKGPASPHWKGDQVGYYGIHDWLYTNYGKAFLCEKCGSTKNVQWAKIAGKEYNRKRENFWQLCSPCHMDYDGTFAPKGWNKGKKWSQSIRQKISLGTKAGMKKAGYKIK